MIAGMTDPPVPFVSAIVLNYRTPQDAVRCVEALLNQTLQSLEILMVDNHSEDDSIGLLRNRFGKHPRVRIIEARVNLGYGQGNALGIRSARGRYLFITNPDNELEPGGLERMVAALEEDPTIGILAPTLMHEDGTIRDSCRTFPSVLDVLIKRTVLRWLCRKRLARYLAGDIRSTREPRDVDWVVGTCMLLRRELYEQLGGFDPRFFIFFDDIDLCRRVGQSGKRVVYFPFVRATDRKRRLSEGGIASLLFHRAGRSHLMSAAKYFWKWGWH